MSRGAKGRALSPEDRRVLSALRARDEAELTVLVERYHPSMVRLARGFVPSQAVAEEVAQAAAPQRVLRHRARARARTALEDHLGADG